MLRITIVLAFLAIAATNGGVVKKRMPIFRHHRIMNGHPASQGEFPSQLSLQWLGSHNCGASILNSEWAVTASHCVAGDTPSDITLYSGSIDLESGGTTHPVAEIIMHEGYDPSDSWKNDIAVIRVSVPFEIDGVNENGIKLPAQGQNPADGATATVIGWGYDEDWTLPSILQEVDIAIVNQEKCNAVYSPDGYPIYEGHICADVPEGGKGSCNGDSGGPLFVDGTVVGLVSWAQGCNTQGYPTVYTRVSQYRDWIQEKTGV